MRLHAFSELDRWLIHFVSVETVALWPSSGSPLILHFLGVEWSLVYEVFLSAAVAIFGLIGPRRGVAALAAIWAAALVVKMIVLPEAYFDAYPRPSRIAFSVHNLPFLLGILAHQVREANARWLFVVAPAVLAVLACCSVMAMTPESKWAAWGVAAAGTVWLAVRLPQLPERNPFVRLGDCTYGLFLFHVPLMMAVLYAAQRLGGTGSYAALALAGGVAVGGGLLFGRMESALHAQLRPLAKLRIPATIRPLRILQRAGSSQPK